MALLTLIADYPASHLTDHALASFRARFVLPPPTILAPQEAVEFDAPASLDLSAVRAFFGAARIDAVLTDGALPRRKSLLVADMDGTLLAEETIDRLAAHAGREAEVAAITRAGMEGRADFAAGLRQRVALLAGLPNAAIEATWQGLTIRAGAAALVATMRANGARTALVTGGFSCFASRLAARLGIDSFCANELLVENGRLTGCVAEPILDRAGKLAALRALAHENRIDLTKVLAVGDGANDLPMLQAAGLGVAFHAKPAVAAQISVRIDFCSLRAILFLQGYRSSEIASAEVLGAAS